MDPHRRSYLVGILQRRTQLRVKEAAAGDRLAAGCVYVAPPDKHMVVRDGGILALTDAARVNYVRPSADALFDSLAYCFGERAIAVVLSGTGRDGARGVAAVQRAGGETIVQDQRTAEHFGMPQAAIDTGCVGRILPLDAIAPALVRLVKGSDN
jgi:two-component system, chemotaxis family, protein-glutamate methylesterase/glutaminase